MFNEEQERDYSPITMIGRFPVHLTELLVVIHVASMVITSLWLGFFSNDALHKALYFSPELVLQKGQVWRFLTYAFVDSPPAGFGTVIWFLIGLLMLWFCGRQLEQFYGRISLLKSYLILCLIPPLLALLPPLQIPMMGPTLVHFGIFIMFAATYPGIQLFFGIEARWIAWAFLFFNSLVYFASHSFATMAFLWSTALGAYALTRLLGRGDWLPAAITDRLPTLGRRNPHFSIVRSERLPPPAAETNDEDLISSIDPILDKIAKRGMGSLSARERAALQAASGELQRKESGK